MGFVLIIRATHVSFGEIRKHQATIKKKLEIRTSHPEQAQLLTLESVSPAVCLSLLGSSLPCHLLVDPPGCCCLIVGGTEVLVLTDKH